MTTIQATAKRQKGIQLIGIGGLLLGLVVAIAGSPEAGGLLATAGLVAYIWGRASAWWHHG